MSKPTRAADGSNAEYQPYVPDEADLPEFTWSALLVGAGLGILFGASSLYLVLKVGMTVSASIPAAVLSITLFRGISRAFGFRQAGILENNIVQTTGSAGESIAFGVGVTMPAVMILGFEMEITRVMAVSILGGVLGILMMIPLRRAFIVKQHGVMKYPEGTACADVLVIGETGGASAKTVFIGFGLAFIFQFLMQGLRLWKEVASRTLDWFKGATPALEASPALLGVGYIIGTRIACVMVAGGILQAFVLVPAIRFFGEGLAGPLEPGLEPIGAMDADAIFKTYVKYIGAGAVAAGGIVSLCRALPLILSSITSGLRDMRGSIQNAGGVRRTERDLSMKIVFFGSLLLVAALWGFLQFDPQTGGGWTWAALLDGKKILVNLAAAALIVLFGFLFVTVSSRVTGELGSSTNPISGMTLTTLLLTCLIFFVLGWTAPPYRLLALSVAAVVCVAASNGGTTSQDLKTGFLVGATPWKQQWAIVVGSVSSSIAIGAVLMAMNDAGTIYSSKNLPALKQPLDVNAIAAENAGRTTLYNDAVYYVWRAADDNPQGVPPAKYLVDAQGRLRYLVDPGISGKLGRKDDGTEVRKFSPPQAELFALITKGILSQKLPWILVLLGVSIALVVEFCGVSSLAFAVGVYLPLSTSTPVFVGGMMRYLVERAARKSGDSAAKDVGSEMSPGSLLSTGYIAGGTIAGVLIAFLNFSDATVQRLAVWQYRTAPAAAETTFDRQCRVLAERELGSESSETRVARLAAQIRELNESDLQRYARVAKGTTLDLPKGERYEAPADQCLCEAAERLFGDADKVSLLFDLNKERLALPESLPAGTAMKIPQRDLPALLVFALLAALLALVGRGRLLKSA